MISSVFIDVFGLMSVTNSSLMFSFILSTAKADRKTQEDIERRRERQRRTDRVGHVNRLGTKICRHATLHNISASNNMTRISPSVFGDPCFSRFSRIRHS